MKKTLSAAGIASGPATVRVKADLAAKGFDRPSLSRRLLLATKIEIEFRDFLRGIGVKIPTVNGTC